MYIVRVFWIISARFACRLCNCILYQWRKEEIFSTRLKLNCGFADNFFLKTVASLIAPDFTIYVYSSSCNYLVFCLNISAFLSFGLPECPGSGRRFVSAGREAPYPQPPSRLCRAAAGWLVTLRAYIGYVKLRNNDDFRLFFWLPKVDIY